jgi:hypothetical protein
MRAAIALVFFLAACTDTSGDDDGSYVDLTVTSQVPFTGLFVFEPGQAVAGAGILTPGLQAAPATAMIESTERTQVVGTGQLGTTYAFERWDIVGGPSRLAMLAVVAQSDGSFVPVAYAETGRLEYVPSHGTSVEASGTLPLAALTGPAEIWGSSCVRMVDGASGTTTYLVKFDDLDCDGIPDDDDCQPRAFCETPGACTRSTGGC